MLTRFTELNLGYSNAENYRMRENKELLNRYFVKDHYLDKLISSGVYFLVGEKGTGKTAYATFLTNTKYHGIESTSYDVRQTEYQKFLELKKLGHLPLSGYVDVWRCLLLMASAQSLLQSSNTPEVFRRFTKLAGLQKAINEFYEDAFSPELIQMLRFVVSSDKAIKLIAKHGESGGDYTKNAKSEAATEQARFQLNLLKIRRAFEEALSAQKLDNDYIIFIDGIDVRPASISYDDYFECIVGLVDAVWAINSDFFANIKGSKGRIRVVLLVRPDILLKTGLHNMNTKLRDNSVHLNWSTSYKDYRSSHLFHVADRLLAAQQSDAKALKPGECWDHYFPFHTENVKAPAVSAETGTNSFLSFLRNSYYRPRDISSMMSILQQRVKGNRPNANYVTSEDFSDPSFKDDLANYLLGEIRDQLLFYYTQEEYDAFLQFFSYLRGRIKFNYEFYLEAFDEFTQEAVERGLSLPQFFENADSYLQFLFEQNIICYKEEGKERRSGKEGEYIRWCFRERTLSNMAPKVRRGAEYEIFAGLSKALNVGRALSNRSKSSSRRTGVVVRLVSEKGFGFIKLDNNSSEYYFKIDDRLNAVLEVGSKVTFIPSTKYSKLRASQVELR